MSRTAMMVAAYRARASVDWPRLCTDPWAYALAGDEGRAIAQAYDATFPPMELWIALRTAFIDAHVRKWIGAGVRQVVLLGAGLDARAARLSAEGVAFFEVDREDTQQEKLRRLAAIPGGYPIDCARYVSCDFEHHDFVDRLIASGFRADEPAFLVWEGVTAYLTEAAVRATLHRIAERCAPKSIVVFDHLRRKIVAGEVRDPRDLESREIVANLGEPLRFGVDSAVPLLFEEGFRRVRSTRFDEICLNFTGTHDSSRLFHLQTMVLASREAELG